ncbi:hypothetical protein PILCRDRAFT_810393 [Piloderma croceum F 1598]|uniref:Peptidase M20 domain-containing protein 2 n=1 Tax=Piloderma croceum (strain F 1598) TaxID=765440 RepID=A0A0C3GL83_PILCF|nr:hypothetical protein PILCRDRAFT_810393 [Piloderma croceum F 1598]
MTSAGSEIWRPEDDHNLDALATSLQETGTQDVYKPEILDAIEATINALSDELREVSLSIHSHPELKFEEKHAHDVLTLFMSMHGFNVQKHFHMPTAWQAIYKRGTGGRTVGINSEMDALPGIGHACGHNLIAISGVGVACAIKAVMERFDISGTILVLGTPAEEGGYGKATLLEKGAYKQMDACLMCHPAPGPRSSVSLSGSLALVQYRVEYFGHSAHAALSPWEGKNALDAAVLAYNNISVLRQQVRPTHRIHGIFQGNDWAPNIIPDNANMHWLVRAPSLAEARATADRVVACFEAAALASGCEVKINEIKPPCYELRQNKALGDALADIVKSRYGYIDYEYGIANASTDFGQVGYALPSLHPGFSIPTVENGGNHTVAFTQSARSLEAHKACLQVTKALAGLGVRILADEEFLMKVRDSFEEDKKLHGHV